MLYCETKSIQESGVLENPTTESSKKTFEEIAKLEKDGRYRQHFAYEPWKQSLATRVIMW
jgi:hypothetical protein